MELGHLLIGQAIIISSLVATITLSESSRCASSLRYLSSLSFVRVSGEKGAILLLFALSCLLLISLNFLVSQAKLCKFNNLHKRARKARSTHLECILIAFIAFISAYIFQNLNFRVYNLLGVSIILLNINSLCTLIGIDLFRTWLYISFVMCTLLVFSFTFIQGMERYYSFVMSLMKIRF